MSTTNRRHGKVRRLLAVNGKEYKVSKVHDEFQDSLREDIKRINNSTKALILFSR